MYHYLKTENMLLSNFIKQGQILHSATKKST